MNPGEIKDLLSSEGREVTAQVTGPAPFSSCSPLAFGIQILFQRTHRHFIRYPRIILSTSKSSWTRDQAGKEDKPFPWEPPVAYVYMSSTFPAKSAPSPE